MGLVTIFNVMVNIFITVRILEMSQSGSPLSADNEHYNFCFTVHKIWRKQYFVARIVGHNDTIPILSVPPPLGTLTLVRRREDGCILVRKTRPPQIALVEHTGVYSCGLNEWHVVANSNSWIVCSYFLLFYFLTQNCIGGWLYNSEMLIHSFEGNFRDTLVTWWWGKN